MRKNEELQTVGGIVLDILAEFPNTRNNDDLLYYKVCKVISPVCTGLPFATVLINRKSYGLPAFETVRRTRQKIQSESPELAACATVQAGRAEKEKLFRAFAKGDICG